MLPQALPEVIPVHRTRNSSWLLPKTNLHTQNRWNERQENSGAWDQRSLRKRAEAATKPMLLSDWEELLIWPSGSVGALGKAVSEEGSDVESMKGSWRWAFLAALWAEKREGEVQEELYFYVISRLKMKKKTCWWKAPITKGGWTWVFEECGGGTK